MNDDLVKRLQNAPSDGLGTENLCLEAADRIEELEAALNVAVKVTLVRAEAYLLTHIASHKAMSPKSRKGTYPQLNEYLVKDMVDTLTK